MLRYQDLAVRTAYILTGDVDEAEDAVQEAFMHAYGALARFRPDAPFRPWLLRIVANEARDHHKATGRRLALALRVTAARPVREFAPSPESHALETERRATLLQAIGRLRDEERLLIAYRYFCDLSEAETAVALDCPRGTMKSRLSCALRRLRDELGELDGAPNDTPDNAPRGVTHG